MKETPFRGRPNRFLIEATEKFYAEENDPTATALNENDPPATFSANDNLASLKTKFTQLLLPNLYKSNLSIHAITVAPPIKRLRDSCIETDWPATRSVASQTPAFC